MTIIQIPSVGLKWFFLPSYGTQRGYVGNCHFSRRKLSKKFKGSESFIKLFFIFITTSLLPCEKVQNRVQGIGYPSVARIH
jgi:hypothetical protein